MTDVLKDAQRMFSYNSSERVDFGALQTKEPYIVPASEIGSVLRVRLPRDFRVTETIRLAPTPQSLPEVSGSAAVAIGAAAVMAKNPTVSRRFWKGLFG